MESCFADAASRSDQRNAVSAEVVGAVPADGVVMPSATIKKRAYDPETNVLSVWFVASGKRYDYEAVPPETYAAFQRAFSKGKFFNEHIRDRFSYRLVAATN